MFATRQSRALGISVLIVQVRSYLSCFCVWTLIEYLRLDYDLCTPCMAAGASEVHHDPFHEFFDIDEPGRVIVHTVFSGNGERGTQGTSATRAPAHRASVTPATEESVIHHANCDLCDSRIRGDRYVSSQFISGQL